MNDNTSTGEMERSLSVTLEQRVQTSKSPVKSFKAVSRNDGDDRMTFSGVNIEGVHSLDVNRSNVRAVVFERTEATEMDHNE